MRAGETREFECEYRMIRVTARGWVREIVSVFLPRKRFERWRLFLDVTQRRSGGVVKGESNFIEHIASARPPFHIVRTCKRSVRLCERAGCRHPRVSKEVLTECSVVYRFVAHPMSWKHKDTLRGSWNPR